nr:MAG TPA: ribosomal protein S13/S15-like protein [Caudoviricetes sp.]
MVFYENRNLNSELTIETETVLGKTKCNIILEDLYREHPHSFVELNRKEVEEIIFSLCKVREELLKCQ